MTIFREILTKNHDIFSKKTKSIFKFHLNNKSFNCGMLVIFQKTLILFNVENKKGPMSVKYFASCYINVMSNTMTLRFLFVLWL